MMKKGVSAVLLCLVVMLMAEVHETTAAAAASAPLQSASCTPTELLPCLGAITGGSDPSPACCSKLKEQQPCFCKYISNPAYKPYIDSPNAKKVAGICGVSFPTC